MKTMNKSTLGHGGSPNLIQFALTERCNEITPGTQHRDTGAHAPKRGSASFTVGIPLETAFCRFLEKHAPRLNPIARHPKGRKFLLKLAILFYKPGVFCIQIFHFLRKLLSLPEQDVDLNTLRGIGGEISNERG
jgi:hypothetical protein